MKTSSCERQALAPPFDRQFRLLIELIDIADTEPGNDLDPLRNAEDLFDIGLRGRCSPSRRRRLRRAAASHRFCTAQTVE